MENKINFRNGKLKILYLCDVQEGPFMIPVVKTIVKHMLKKTNPDLIILGGDNIAGYACRGKSSKDDERKTKKALNNLMSIIQKNNISTAFVFGNHDSESKCTRAKQIELYKEYSCCMADNYHETNGLFSSYVKVMSGEKEAFRLWLMDTDHSCVKEEQLKWFNTEYEKSENLPSFVFQHITVKEVYDYFNIVDKDTENAVFDGENYYVLNEKYCKNGVLNERPEVGRENYGFFDSCIEKGNVSAIFTAHDHVNTYEIKTDKGIDFIATPGITFNSYGDENRGSRIITLNEKDLSYDTEVVNCLKLFKNHPLAMLNFRLTWFFHDLLEKLGNLLRK